MSDLFNTNKEYNEAKPNWRLVRDLIKGESALKNHDLKGISRNSRIDSNSDFVLNDRYLPIPDADNCSTENLTRYFQYVQRASLFNAVKRTEQGMSGMVFSKPNTVELPAQIDYLKDDADGSEVGIEQQASEVLNDVLETGREGLLVDFPSTDGATSVQEAEDLAVRANIVVYKAESILDWDTIKVNAANKLSFVKLQEFEVVRDPNNIFATVDKKICRVLLLNNDGVYEQRVYRENTDDFDSTIPTDNNDQPFDFIPFFFIGSVNNKPNVDPIPLIEISEVNIAHYRNSADFEESSFIVGQPTLAISGLNQAWVKDNFENGVGFGSRGGIPLPVGGAANLIQAGPNTMPENGMDRKQKQMIELGARLITDGTGSETAEAAKIKHGADASVLKVIVRNINQAYTDAIKVVQMFMTGSEEDVKFQINTDFFASTLTAQELTAYVASWQQGAFTKDVLDDKLVSGGVISEEVNLEDMNRLLSETPTSPNFDDPIDG